MTAPPVVRAARHLELTGQECPLSPFRRWGLGDPAISEPLMGYSSLLDGWMEAECVHPPI